MEFRELLKARRSVRKYLPKSVERTILVDIAKMALTAPSARNSRSTKLLIVDDSETIAKMAQMRDYGSAFMASAPAAIVVMGDSNCDLWVDNCAIVASYIQLACVECGLASCWVHVEGRHRVRVDKSSPKADEYLREILPIEQGYNIECIIALGYTDFTPKPLPEFNPSDSISFYK